MIKMVVRKLVVGAKITVPGSGDFVSISPHVGVEVDVEIPISGDGETIDEDEVERPLREAYEVVQSKIMQLLVLQALDLEGATNVHASGGMQALVEEFLVEGDETDE